MFFSRQVPRLLMQRGTTVLGVATPHALSSIQTCFSRQALPEMPSTRSTWRKLSVVTVRLLASVWSLLCGHFRITEFGAGEARKSAESFVGHVEQLLERLLRRQNAPPGPRGRRSVVEAQPVRSAERFCKLSSFSGPGMLLRPYRFRLRKMLGPRGPRKFRNALRAPHLFPFWRSI
jgi:hypothetical protein